MIPDRFRLAMLASAVGSFPLATLPYRVRQNNLPAGYDPVARLAAFQRQRPRPWRTGSRHSNRNIRRAVAQRKAA